MMNEMMNDPYAAATSQLGGTLRGRSIEQIMKTLQESIPPADLYSDLSPIQEREEDPISEKVMQFISKLQGGEEEEEGSEFEGMM